LTDIFLEGGRALIGSELVETSILVSGADIAQVDASRGRTRLAIDARNLLVLPGIVDLHGDAFERQMMPRAGVDFPIDVALADSDRQAISNGITTVFHATTCSWEPGLRSADNARSLMEAIERQRPQFAADTRFQANKNGKDRQQTATKAVVAEKLGWPAAPLSVPQLALPLATQLAAPLNVTPAGSASTTVRSRASVGPALPTTIA